jgi:uncharacterized membrane protein YhaH (DUF805 family)
VKQRLLQLIGGCTAFWALLALPAYFLGGDTSLLYSATAAVLCLVPTAVTQVWIDLALGKSQEHQLAAALGGSGIRIAVVLLAGMLLYLGLNEYHSAAFWLWIVVFYLATLTMEIFLVVRRQAEMER